MAATGTKTFAQVLDLPADGFRRLQFLGEAAYVNAALGRWQQAREIFEGVVAIDPQDPAAHIGLAELFFVRSNFREAEASAKRALRAANQTGHSLSIAHLVRGRALMGLHRAKEAAQAWRDAIEAEPDCDAARDARGLLEQAATLGLIPAEAAGPPPAEGPH